MSCYELEFYFVSYLALIKINNYFSFPQKKFPKSVSELIVTPFGNAIFSESVSPCSPLVVKTGT